MYVSGQFRNVNGVAGGFLVKLDPVTGARDTSFNAAPTGMVYDIHLHGSTLFAVGTFARIRNLVRTNRDAQRDDRTGRRGRRALHHRGHRHHPGHASRRHAGRVGPGGDRQLHPGGRPVPAEHRQARHQRHHRDTQQLVHGRVSLRGLLVQLRHLRPRHRLLPGRHLLRRRHHRRLSGATLLCDSAARWETAATGTVTPTWVDYTGGDSLSSVAITGAAMYVAGHQRWHNNAIPPSGDRLGPGGVDRLGIAALDVESGVPLSWNPTREAQPLRGG